MDRTTSLPCDPSGPRPDPELDFDRLPEVLGELRDIDTLGLFSVDARGRIIAWSRGAERLTGFRKTEVQGRPPTFLEGPECRGFEQVHALLAGEAPRDDWRRECRIVNRCGETRTVIGSAHAVRRSDGTITGALVVFLDITDSLRESAPAPLPEPPQGLLELQGGSSSMLEVYRRIRLASDSDVTTVITGESGTGKELAARAIHELSERREGPFIALNCAAIPETLLESELFGHARGAFTGATRDRSGMFQLADGGTLFLDEVGDTGRMIQLKLLRVLQEREVRPIGGDHPVSVDVRLVTATHRDLSALLASHQMREDFYYRIRVFEIHMPALRERLDDVGVLAAHFAGQIAGSGRAPSITREALEAMIRYPWPGNVRELRNAIEHAMVVCQGDTIGLLDLPESVQSVGGPIAAHDSLSPMQEIERRRILEALEANGWNRTRTAESLGVSRVTLWKKIRRYRIDEGVFRRGTRNELDVS
ncbi:MAG: sigma 54-interacting transcriptional regulator [Planctomycetota bacterium]